MLTIDQYCERAKEKLGTVSNRELARRLGVSPATENNWRTKRAWPSDVTMIRLAALAEIDPETALLHLNAWRSEGAARSIYEGMLAKVGAVAALALCIYIGHPQPIEAKEFSITDRPTQNAATIYYGKFILLIGRLLRIIVLQPRGVWVPCPML